MMLGVGKSSISGYENGEGCPLDSLITIAQLGKISLDWLVTGQDITKTQPCDLLHDTATEYNALPEPISRIAEIVKKHPGSEWEAFVRLMDFYEEREKKKLDEKE